MVVDALPGEPEPARQTGGGIGVFQLRQELLAGRVEEGGGGRGPADDLKGKGVRHGNEDAADSIFCQ
jgi:hypothetical protein